jgi:two-component system OmpR family sensor kinase
VSLRGRLLLALLVIVTAGLLVADVATYQALHSFLVKKVDAQIDGLRDPVANQVFRVDHHGPSPLPDNTSNYTEVRDSANTVLYSNNPAAFGHPKPTSTPAMPAKLPIPPVCVNRLCDSSITIDVPSKEAGGPGYRAHVWSVPTTAGEPLLMIIALPLADVNDTLSQLLTIEALVTLLVLAGAGGAGLYLVRLGLRPLREIETTAGAIADGDLGQRVKRADSKTEVGRLGIALNTMLGQIESAFAEKDASEQRLRRFLADASHELRTPLTSIRGYAELFRRGADTRPADLAKVMLRIEEESTRMGLLVDDLLLLARLDQGPALERQPVDMTIVVEEAVDAASAVEPDRPIGFQATGPMTVSGDALRLRQVVDNLLANVRTHTPAGTPATVTLEPGVERVILEVSDLGPGLPREGRERIFNRFYRADPARSRDRGGAGLGLAIIHAIVTAHGGSLTVSDNVPSGTIFRIELPVADAPTAAAGSEPATYGEAEAAGDAGALGFGEGVATG